MRRADDVQFYFGVLCTERRLIQAGAEAAAAVTGRCGFGAGQNAGRSAGYPADLPARGYSSSSANGRRSKPL